MSRSHAQLATRKILDETLILSECIGATCQAIADRLGEDALIVKRHLKRMVAHGLITEARERGYLRYRKA